MVDADSRPLAGIRVLAHVVGIAGPIASRVFAWFGADVIRLESRVNPDLIRRVGSRWLGPDAHGPEVWTDSSPLLNELWGGVRSVGLNLKDPEAFAAAERLIASCDVFLSNFSAPALRDSGLGYEALAALRPDLVYVVLPGFGATEGTPYHDYLAWGPNQAPLVGLDELTGWPDRPPAAIASIALPDYTNGLTGVVGALAALEHRDRTGEGQRVEVAQFEATVALLGDLFLDHELTGNVPGRAGNRGGWAAPRACTRAAAATGGWRSRWRTTPGGRRCAGSPPTPTGAPTSASPPPTPGSPTSMSSTSWWAGGPRATPTPRSPSGSRPPGLRPPPWSTTPPCWPTATSPAGRSGTCRRTPGSAPT